MSSAPGAPHGSRRLSIVVDSDTFGGAERYVALLLEHLPEQFLPTMLCTRPAPRRSYQSHRGMSNR